MKRSQVIATAAILVLAAGGGLTVAAVPAGAATCTFGWPSPDPYNASCQYSYSGSSYFTGMPSSASAPGVSQNVWSQDTGYSQSLTATDPGHWTVTANTNSLGSSSGIEAYPNTGWGMAWPEQPVDGYSDIESSWNVTLPAAGARVAGWAAYDLWFNNWADEVMIQTDITAPQPQYACPAIYAQATIDGLPWYLCVFGSERVWKPGTGDSNIQSMASGQLNITPFITYLEGNTSLAAGAMPAGSTWTAGGFGFEVADTGGAAETFAVNGFTWSMSGGGGGQPPPAAPGGLSQTPHVLVNFGWQAVSGWSGSYEFQLQDGSGAVVSDQAVSALSIQGLEVTRDTAYKWRVRASGGTWSALRSFTAP